MPCPLKTKLEPSEAQDAPFRASSPSAKSAWRALGAPAAPRRAAAVAVGAVGGRWLVLSQRTSGYGLKVGGLVRSLVLRSCDWIGGLGARLRLRF